MSKVFDVVAGAGVLIAIFLFLFHGDKTVKIITSLSSAATSAITSLQGRG